MFSFQCILDDLLSIIEYFNYFLLQSILRLGHRENGKTVEVTFIWPWKLLPKSQICHKVYGTIIILDSEA